jgi:hypothetical protein
MMDAPGLLAGIILVLLLFVAAGAAIWLFSRPGQVGVDGAQKQAGLGATSGTASAIPSYWRGGQAVPGSLLEEPPERRSVYAALNRLYSTADVDPIITGQLYEHADFVRNVYAQRTSHGDVWGLTEYSTSGAPGDVGVDVGPYGLDEYGGREVGFDDGIPAEWAFPSTPVRWYGPKQRDYYGIEGPTVYSEGLYTLSEPDHDPLVG